MPPQSLVKPRAFSSSYREKREREREIWCATTQNIHCCGLCYVYWCVLEQQSAKNKVQSMMIIRTVYQPSVKWSQWSVLYKVLIKVHQSSFESLVLESINHRFLQLNKSVHWKKKRKKKSRINNCAKKRRKERWHRNIKRKRVDGWRETSSWVDGEGADKLSIVV